MVDELWHSVTKKPDDPNILSNITVLPFPLEDIANHDSSSDIITPLFFKPRPGKALLEDHPIDEKKLDDDLRSSLDFEDIEPLNKENETQPNSYTTRWSYFERADGVVRCFIEQLYHIPRKGLPRLGPLAGLANLVYIRSETSHSHS